MQIPGYSIQRSIGKGGMATVYLAIQQSLGRPVVLKILDQMNAQQSEDMAERFIAEGRIIASLHHPNIITIYDIGVADKSLYISMEYVQGGDLKRRMELPMSVDEALDYLSKIASALGEAHKHGIVHRDVKPANILFRDDTTPLLTDFGIAKQVDTETDLTSTGIFLGSPNYVSPEQADGVRIDGRADIYSLGCIFYEMLTGKKPYISDSVIDIVIQHKSAPVPTLPKEYRELQPLLDRMMSKRRDERFPDAEAVIDQIGKIQKIRRRQLQVQDLDATGTIAMRREVRDRRAKQALATLILMGVILFSSLKYVEIRIKRPSVRPEDVSTQTVLPTATAAPVAAAVAEPAPPGPALNSPVAESPAAAPAPPPEDVVKALLWLGKQSLDDYKLTYPPKDNAYYYYGRLLEIDPGNPDAVKGMLEIADRYGMLAEQSMARNEMDKTASFIEIGLRIDPDNKTLLSLKGLASRHDTSLLATLKSLFARK